MGAAARQGRLRRGRPRLAPRARRTAGALALAALPLGCAALAPPVPAPLQAAWQDPFPPGPPSGPREWISAGAGLLERRDEAFDLGDGFALALDLGMELASPERTRLVPSLEVGVAATWHGVREPGFEDASRIALGRFSLGGRLALSPGRARLSPHVRAGVFHRFEIRAADDPPGIPNQEENGRYLGAGLDVTSGGRPTWGLFGVVYDGDDGLEERMFGINATVWY